MALLHYQDENIMEKKEKIENSVLHIKNEGVSISIGHFDIWTLKKGYYVAEMKVTVHFEQEILGKEETNYKVIEQIQNKIFSICRENKINEHYIDVS